MEEKRDQAREAKIADHREEAARSQNESLRKKTLRKEKLENALAALKRRIDAAEREISEKNARINRARAHTPIIPMAMAGAAITEDPASSSPSAPTPPKLTNFARFASR